MTDERSGSGDPARTLALLWGKPLAPSRRGPARGLELSAVVDTAIGLADREGLAAVTMRAVSRALGVVPMTLYTYVPGKAEMLDLMLDAVYIRTPRADTTGARWRTRLTAVADENRALFSAHPWAAEISTLRPPLGPGLMAKYEHELSALDGLGLSDVEMDDCLTYLLSFVQANAREAHQAAAVATAGDDAQWWARVGPLLAQVLDERRYPLASRVGTAAGEAHGSAHDPDHAYRFGLARVLDGLASLIERAEPGSPGRQLSADGTG
ncbi:MULTISPECIES: TetR/AcrR family transcriptional regulator [unclassified Pseudofrankia]|uniref:TetR/AcrR family transcriptional regulator n=1 Tax=unclassified Pseudofrankia TaxID=2994372 RepID=UPI0008DA1C03|nr:MULTISPECIES: TetR/AcrR family transcriptional regulator [unclassified Pseudofrankia]MDT3440987.1 TetR/AcrR family transcriptional regulator [Pseudofrankia sp. BMG5.37]OHV45490.1 TetR family transcriptional regulator [Pseudofrankia sp. BMG5.36]